MPRGAAAVALAVAAAVLLLTGLGAIDLWAPDEPRYAQVAEEVRALEPGPSALVLLHLNGAPYTQKPPLYYWLAALAGSATGRVGEWAARLPSALAGLAGVLLTLRLGRELWPGSAGVWGGFLLLGVFRYAHLARRAQLDVLLALFELIALLAFWRVDRGRMPAPRGAALLHAALGLAVLTKGPVGLLPLLVMAAFLVWEGRPRDMRRLLPAWGWLLSLGPVLVWLAGSVWIAPPGFFGDAVVDNVLHRFFSGTSHARPIYYFAYQFPIDFLPWTLLWPLAVPAVRAGLAGDTDPSARAAWRFATAGVALMLVFFSLSAGKRGLYLLPAYPLMALICGATLAGWLERGPALRQPWSGLGIALACALCGAGGLIAASGGLEVPGAPGFVLPAGLGLAWLGIGAAALVAARLVAGRFGAAASALGVLVAGVLAVELAVFTLAFPSFDSEKSPRPAAEAAAAVSAQGSSIAIFDHRSMVGGLAYYSGRHVVALPDVQAARDFLDGGGGAIVVRHDKLGRLEPAGPFAVRHRSRTGRRELLVVTPSGAAPGPPEERRRAPAPTPY